MPLVICGNKISHLFLHDNIKPYGWLIEKQYPGRMNEACNKLHFHTFSERKFTNRNFQKITNIKKINKLIKCSFILIDRHLINFFIEEKCFDSRQIPPELVLLTHHESDAFEKIILSFKWCITQDGHF